MATSSASVESAMGIQRESIQCCSHDHHVQFYEDDAFLTDVVARFAEAGLSAGERVLLIMTEPHRTLLVAKLTNDGHDVASLQNDRHLTVLDAHHTLALFMRDNRPLTGRFRESVGELVEDLMLLSPVRPLRAYGEMVDVLWQEGNETAAIELEEQWNELGRRHNFLLLCAYSMKNFSGVSHAEGVEQVLSQHNHVIPAETFSAIDNDERGREIVRLQQRARALETEIEEGRRLEDALRTSLAEQRITEEALKESEEHLRDFVENAALGLHWVAADGTILWANRAELAMVGYDADEYIGRNIAMFHRDADVIGDIMARLGRGEDLADYESTLVCRDGSERTVLINSNVLWKEGKFVHTRCFTRDITLRKKAEAELLTAKEEAERASKIKSELLAVVSHELRTPLNAITGYESLLSQEIAGPISPEQSVFLERIRTASSHLLSLIDQLLTLSRIQAGKEEVAGARVDIVELTRAAVSLIEPTAARKNLDIKFDGFDQSLPIATDAQKVSQILLNLLSNAVKFTERGSIDLRLDRKDSTVHLSVTDSGAGIRIEDLERIFEPFVQVDGSSTRRHGGTGLGLAVSRDLAHLLGGDLVVTSEIGVGSTFTLQLPLNLPHTTSLQVPQIL